MKFNNQPFILLQFYSSNIVTSIIAMYILSSVKFYHNCEFHFLDESLCMQLHAFVHYSQNKYIPFNGADLVNSIAIHPNKNYELDLVTNLWLLRMMNLS